MIRLEINGWEANIGFSASHILPSHHKCRRIHGHNYAVSARIEGEQTEDGFVFDFLPLKKVLRKISDELDHRMLIADGMESYEEKDGEIIIRANDGRYVIPENDVVILDIDSTTTENLAQYILKRTMEEIDFPENIMRLEIGVDESRGQGAWAGREL